MREFVCTCALVKIDRPGRKTVRRTVHGQTFDDVAQNPALGSFEFRQRRPDRAFRAIAFGNRKPTIMNACGRIAMIRKPAQFRNTEIQCFRELRRCVERGQFIFGGTFFGVGNVPFVFRRAVGPVDTLAKMHNVVGSIRLPRVAAEAFAFFRFGFQLFFVGFQFPIRHAVGRTALHEETAFLQLRINERLRAARLLNVCAIELMDRFVVP